MTWPEQKKLIQTNKGTESKAPIHHKVAIKSSYQTTLRTPLLSQEESDFMSNPAKYINEFSPLYSKALQSPTKEKWTARSDYIKLLIKKALEHTIKPKEAQHFIMYLKEIKEDVKTQEPLKKELSLYEDFITKISNAPDKSVLTIISREIDASSLSPTQKNTLTQILKKKFATFLFTTDPEEDLTLINEFKTKISNATTIEQLNNINTEIIDSVAEGKFAKAKVRRELVHELHAMVDTRIKSLTTSPDIYRNLISQIKTAETTQKLDDLHQDANRAEVKGQITFQQLQEIYMLINDRDEKVRIAQKARLENLQSQYKVGDFLERLPNIESVIKSGLYTITEIIPHKEMTFGNISPADIRVVNEYRIAGVRPDGTLNQIGGMVLTATILSNTFKKVPSQRKEELSRATADKTVEILLEGISKITTIQGLNEFDQRLREYMTKGGIMSVQDPRIEEVIVAINKRRRELGGFQKTIKTADEWEIKNLEYEAQNKPKEMLPPKTYDDVTKYTWGLPEHEAIKKYVEKELNKYQSNIDYTNKQKADLDAIENSKPWVLLTKAQILKEYPDKAEEYTRDLWSYKSKKSDWEKNENGAKYWREKVEKIASGEWEKINNNYLKEQWQKEVKTAISKGKPVPYDIIKTYPEFTKAQTKRDSYDKGLHTSFGNESIAIDRTHKENSGVKIKIQSGRAMDEKTADEILLSLSQYQSAVGDITDIMKREDITISHTDYKHPYLSKVAGMYHPTQKTLSVGYAGWKAMSHELTHMIDETSKNRHKDQPLYDYSLLAYAKRNLNGGVERAISLSKSKSPEELEESRNLRFHISTYWARPEELWSRLVEQYTAWKNQSVTNTGISNESYKRYTKTPAYWSDDVFMTMKNQIETELERKLRLARN